MKIAIPTNDGISISEHFGRSKGFLVLEVVSGKIRKRELRENGMVHSHAQGECDSHSHGTHSHAGILSALHDCQLVLCLGMGGRAAEALEANGINTLLVSPGSVDEAVASYLAGSLTPAPASFCHCGR
jgi:predicted Fe-Mo cluster-binding NifX family protein